LRAILRFTLGAIAFGSVFGAIADAQLPPGNAGQGVEPSQCITDTTLQISVAPGTVDWKQTASLHWSVAVPANCPNVNVTLDNTTVPRTGARTVVPAGSRTYRLLASERRGGTFAYKSASASIAVRYPPLVLIDQSVADPVNVLVGALASDNPDETVELCNVNVDLTGRTGILIGDSRKLIAAPGCERNLRQPGPRIFVKDARGSSPLFEVRGDNVVISGFRLEGPTNYIAQDGRKEKGILINPWGFATPIRSIEVSNMEIYYWSGLGVQVTDNVDEAQRGRLFNTNVGAVHVWNNYFHHNRHGAGEGYGAEVSAGAYALIEQNVFDQNRHAIAGGSKHDKSNDYSGYTARDNLILAGGGRHCRDSKDDAWWGGGLGAIVGGIIGGLIGLAVGGLPGLWVGLQLGAGAGAVLGIAGGAIEGSWCSWTHQVDMHGDGNIWPGKHNWLCGTAGETMIIERNTILYTNGAAIKIRGNPADKAVVDNNVFRNGSRSDAIQQTGSCGWFWGDNITNPIKVTPSNRFGAPDPTKQLGSCDLFGDGRQDQFMTTGVTWWAKSGKTGQYYYLNTMPEKLADLRLGDVDGDHICDVTRRSETPPRFYSKSARTKWIPINSPPVPPGGPVFL
jgi:hypothetical protein